MSARLAEERRPAAEGRVYDSMRGSSAVSYAVYTSEAGCWLLAEEVSGRTRAAQVAEE